MSGERTCLGGELETVKGLTKPSSQKRGKVLKAKKSSQKQKKETLGLRRAQFPFRRSVTKVESAEKLS